MFTSLRVNFNVCKVWKSHLGWNAECDNIIVLKMYETILLEGMEEKVTDVRNLGNEGSL